MKMLFIGGSKDGEYIDISDKRTLCELPIPTPRGKVETYRKVGISLCEMMVIDYLPVGEVIPRLMSNYRPEV